jgi:CDP-paratose 2-epimerase
MSIAIITGASGLVGSEAVRLFAAKGFDVIGIDNDMRARYFGPDSSTLKNRADLSAEIKSYRHNDIDIRDGDAINALFADLGGAISVIVHAAAQPSHDWASQDPVTDFSVNATGTLILLEALRHHCPEAVFLHMSTNKVYGDTPNSLPLIEAETRWTVDSQHPYAESGIDEAMSIDTSVHSFFGVSKAAADLMVQEYGRNLGLKTVAFRCGCITGPAHTGAVQHGFLAYLAQCAVKHRAYTIFGYKGKQVRDNISGADLAEALWQSYQSPKPGEVYNMGGGVYANCSVLEAITICEEITGREMGWNLDETNRTGDHIWYVSDIRKFQSDHPAWQPRQTIKSILGEIIAAQKGQEVKN